MTTVTKSVGTSGRDYSTYTLAEADATAVASGNDYVMDGYKDSVFDESVLINDEGPTTLTMTAHAGERHTGVAGTGVRIVRSTNNTILIGTGSGTKKKTVSWIEAAFSASASGTPVGVSGVNTGNISIFLNLLIHGGRGFTTSSTVGVNLWGAAGSYAANCIVFDFRNTYTGASSDIVRGLWQQGDTAKFYNCTAHDIRNATVSGKAYCVSGADTSGFGAQNCIATDPVASGASGTAACFNPSSYSTATVDHNLSSDTTASGTGSLTSKASSSQFVSTALGSEDLHLKAGADAIGAGVDLVTTPTGVQFDIDNYDRDTNNSVWDIGADQSLIASKAMAPYRQAIRTFSRGF